MLSGLGLLVILRSDHPTLLDIPKCIKVSNIPKKLGRKVAIADSLRFMTDCLKAVGANSTAAYQQAKLLIEADIRGHPSHGLNRIEFYIKDITSGACKPNNEPKVLKETPSTAWVDANNVLGATSSHFAMDIAIKKAKTTGVGWVTVKGANHFGMAGWWAEQAADKGLIGMALTNTSPIVVPTRAKKPALGTNPIAVVAPTCEGQQFYLDMATSAVAMGKIEIAVRKGEEIPLGWALGPGGRPTTKADLAFETACLNPLGGAEETSGYKGYGLSAMVELFCGICSGSKYGHHIRLWDFTGQYGPPNLGHCFVAINPDGFAPGFGDRLTEAMEHWRKLPSMSANKPVLAPGDKEHKAAAEAIKQGSVHYVEQQLESSKRLADKLKIKPLVDYL